MTYVVLLSIVALLFGLAYVTKRRYGILGLGLSAGSLLATTYGTPFAEFLSRNDLVVGDIPSDVLARCSLILLPSLVLLLGGPRYSKTIQRVAGSVAFALLAGLLLLAPLSTMLEATGTARDVLLVISNYQSSLIALGVAIAVFDTFRANSPKSAAVPDKH